MNLDIPKQSFHKIAGKLVGIEEEGFNENLNSKYNHDGYELYFEFYTPWNQDLGTKTFELQSRKSSDGTISSPVCICACPEIIKLYPMMPSTENASGVVSMQFIKILENFGFTDFRTYPIRVYEILNYHVRHNSVDEHVKQTRPYHDELYVILQLTNPRLFVGLDYTDWKTRDYPTLFRDTSSPISLYCNSEAAKEFSKYPSLSISPPVSN